MVKKLSFLLVVFSLVFLSACGVEKSEDIGMEEARVKAESFINDNFMDPAYPVNIVSVEDDKVTGLYKLMVDLGEGQIIESYISKDGKKLFPEAYNITEIEEAMGENNIEVDPIEMIEDGSLNENLINESVSFDSDKDVVVYFFWGDGCPHCDTQKNAMSSWSEKYENIEIKAYETWSNQGNRAILEDMATAYDSSAQGVPMTFIGDMYWVGFAPSLESEMEEKIIECLDRGCENPGDRIK
jgi:thiol-disulfide isomerase/thioredoxin